MSYREEFVKPLIEKEKKRISKYSECFDSYEDYLIEQSLYHQEKALAAQSRIDDIFSRSFVDKFPIGDIVRSMNQYVEESVCSRLLDLELMKLSLKRNKEG